MSTALCRALFFTLPLMGRGDALSASGCGSFIQFNYPHPRPLPTKGRGGPWGVA